MEALKEENKRLKQALKDLLIEKNRLEDRMYRAFQKCLNTKKRKISELLQEVEQLQGKAKKSKRSTATLDDEDICSVSSDESENRCERGTDLDDDISDVSSIKSTSSSPPIGSPVITYPEQIVQVITDDLPSSSESSQEVVAPKNLTNSTEEKADETRAEVDSDSQGTSLGDLDNLISDLCD